MYTTVNDIKQTIIPTTAFKGLNYNEEIGQGEFSEAINMDNEDYPVLKSHPTHAITKDYGSDIWAMAQRGDSIWYVDDGFLYRDDGSGVKYNPTAFSLGSHYFVNMGAYLILFPEGFYVNTENTTEKGYINRSYNTGNTSTSFTLCKQDGTAYATPIVSNDEPDNPDNGDLWIDTTQTPHMLKQWSSTSAMWVEIPTVYCKIANTGIGSGLKMYDSVEISGIVASGSPIEDQLNFLNGTMIVYDCGNDYIVVAGIIDQTATLTDDIHVDMTMPEMDYVCEANNRLWGCKYGIVNGKAINEIYASKLGDFRNWKNYMGLSTDSYAVSVGTDGYFTGCVNYLGYPIFFKENCIHKIYGQLPSNFQVQTTMARGVKANCFGSLCIIDEVLYYQSPVDFVRYDGSLPQKVSDALGDLYVWASCCGNVNGILHMGCIISTDINRGDESAAYFTYDPKMGIWQRWDVGEDTTARFWCNWYGIPGYLRIDGKMCCMEPIDGENYTYIPTKWELKSGRMTFGDDQNTMKLLKVTVRMRIAQKAFVKAYVEYDDDGVWNLSREFRAGKLGTYILPIFIKKCDHVRIKLKGEGNVSIFQINQVYVEGANR